MSQQSVLSKSPRVSSEKKKSHQEMYKVSPDFRQIYKEQCISALHQRRSQLRSKLVDKFRNIDLDDEENDDEIVMKRGKDMFIRDVMKSVWKQCVNNDSQGMVMGLDPESELTLDEDFMRQIKMDLEAETQYWEEFVEQRDREEIEWLLTSRDSLVCFMCKRNLMQVGPSSGSTNLSSGTLNANPNLTQLECVCGFQFSTNTALTSEGLQDRLHSLISAHSETQCPNHNVNFIVISDEDYYDVASSSQFNSNHIFMTCDMCQNLALLI